MPRFYLDMDSEGHMAYALAKALNERIKTIRAKVRSPEEEVELAALSVIVAQLSPQNDREIERLMQERKDQNN